LGTKRAGSGGKKTPGRKKKRGTQEEFLTRAAKKASGVGGQRIKEEISPQNARAREKAWKKGGWGGVWQKKKKKMNRTGLGKCMTRDPLQTQKRHYSKGEEHSNETISKRKKVRDEGNEETGSTGEKRRYRCFVHRPKRSIGEKNHLLAGS